MLAIDEFKKVNDGYAHYVGDHVLVEVAKVLRNQSQGHNFARLGGEEFALVAQLTDVGAAQELARGIVLAVSSSRVFNFSLSISVGLADHKTGESISSLMRRADQAVYEAKNAGKNGYAMAGQALLGA